MEQQKQISVVVDWSQLRLERHVEEALEEASRLAAHRPVNASHLLQGAISTDLGPSSGAFKKLASLFPSMLHMVLKTARSAPLDRAAMLFEGPLANSYRIAQSLFLSKGLVWGRDFITLALLTQEDESLSEMAAGSNTSIEQVRDSWFDFLVQTPNKHRTPEEWKQWWQTAGVQVPGGSQTEQGESAYLLTWNPTLYPMEKMEALVNRFKKRDSVEFGWSTGNRKAMELGERVFLYRQGRSGEKRGLVGVGEIAGPVEEKDHWRKEARAEGKKSLIVKVKWSALSLDPFVSLSNLISLTDNEDFWSTRAGGIKIDPDVRSDLELEWPIAWARHQQGLEEALIPSVDPKRLIARFNADQGSDTDRLNIDSYVNAFARVMASRELRPPLSIGLFGDWGSGKTFFMNRLQNAIADLSSGESPDSEHFLSNICQIEFNAWHYAETNLWASLVSTIFRELRRFLDGPEDNADEFNKMLNELELASELRKEAEERRTEAEKQLTRAREEFAKAEQAMETLPPPKPLSNKRMREILSQSFSELTRSPDEVAGLLEDAAELSGNADLKSAADSLRKGKLTVDDAKALLEQSRVFSSRAGFWWRVLSTAKLHRTKGFWLVILAFFAIPVIFGAFEQIFSIELDWAAFLGEAILVVGSTVGWARSTLAKGSPIFDRLDSVQSSIEQKIKEARNEDQRDYEKALDTFRKAERTARDDLERVRSSLCEAEKNEQQAKIAVEESTSQARLGRFIRNRAEDADYDKYLGLIAMIHRDFKKLSDLMQKNLDGKSESVLPRVDRIVLYIDDLDRCYPPARVVMVLEAVHLMLSFPLFVVIVGVDSRWVSRSLDKHYQDMLADESDRQASTLGSLRRAPADSQDFLEKIFQVPFWLRKMDSHAVQRLIHSLITAEEVAAESHTFNESLNGDDADDGVGEDMVMGGGADQQSTGDNRDITPVEDATQAATRRVTREAEAEEQSIDEPLAPPTEGLKISERELRFMDVVAPLMPRTPRSVKRFVNIYRLYKAALSTQALARFMGTPENPGNFKAVQILLALVIGTPSFAKAVVGALDGSLGENKKLSNLVTSIELEDEDWQKTIDALKKFAKGDNDLPLDALRQVSPLVCRYSVHHMVSSHPGESSLQ